MPRQLKLPSNFLASTHSHAESIWLSIMKNMSPDRPEDTFTCI